MTKYQFLQEILKIKDKSLLAQLGKKAKARNIKKGRRSTNTGGQMYTYGFSYRDWLKVTW